MIIQEIVRVKAPHIDGIALEKITPFLFTQIQTAIYKATAIDTDIQI